MRRYQAKVVLSQLLSAYKEKRWFFQILNIMYETIDMFYCGIKHNRISSFTYFAMTLMATLSPVARDRPFLTLAKLPLFHTNGHSAWRINKILYCFTNIGCSSNLLANDTFNFVILLNIWWIRSTRSLCFNHLLSKCKIGGIWLTENYYNVAPN